MQNAQGALEQKACFQPENFLATTPSAMFLSVFSPSPQPKITTLPNTNSHAAEKTEYLARPVTSAAFSRLPPAGTSPLCVCEIMRGSCESRLEPQLCHRAPASSLGLVSYIISLAYLRAWCKGFGSAGRAGRPIDCNVPCHWKPFWKRTAVAPGLDVVPRAKDFAFASSMKAEVVVSAAQEIELAAP
jgi:hypothetical protein